MLSKKNGNLKLKTTVFFFTFIFTLVSNSMPAQILLIRHAEKPEVGSELSSQGWNRARALPNMFERAEFQKFGQPVALYGMLPHKAGASIRSIQTLIFLSEKLKLPIIKKFNREQVLSLIQDIKKNKSYDGKLIVICWQHDGLEKVASELGVKNKLNWDGDVFDRVWSITYSKDQKTTEFQDLPQKVLPFDSQK